MLGFFLPFFVRAAVVFSEFSQKIDHYNESDSRTFQQRIFFDTQFTNGPPFGSFVLILGDFSRYNTEILKFEPILSIAKDTKSVIFGIENRYFGDSKPFLKANAQEFEYLSIDQILSDIVAIISDHQERYCNGKCRILATGNGYAGSLATWLRVKYPHIVDVLWSSGAPLYASQDYSLLDQYAAEYLYEINSKCMYNIRSLFQSLQTDLFSKDNHTIQSVYQLFGFSSKTSLKSAMFMPTDLLTRLIVSSSNNYLQELCKYQTPTPDRIAYARFFNSTLSKLGLTVTQIDPQECKNDDIRALYYLKCKTLGWMDVSAGLGPPLRLKPFSIDMQYFWDTCNKLFGEAGRSYSTFNYNYGGRNPQVTTSIFTTSSKDPWKYLGFQKSNINSQNEVLSIDIGNNQIGLEMKNYSTNDNQDLNTARSQIIATLSSWLSNNCSKLCMNGKCILNSCVCNAGYSGTFCSHPVASSKEFKTLSGALILVPTAFMLVIGLISWRFVFIKGLGFSTRPMI